MPAVDRRRLVAAAAAALAMPALARFARGQTPQVTLKLHHFLPAVSNPHTRFLKPWADKVMAASGGRLRIDIFPSMQLGGAPPQLFDQARDGVADIVWTLPGNTPGRFPKIEVFELPFVPHRKGITNALAVQEFAEGHLMDEFREVKPLCVWAHDHGLIHANRQVRTLDDLKGLKLRFPTRQSGEALKALGAGAIGMPVPQVAESLAQRVIDGCVLPWEVVPAIKVHELVRFHTELPGSPTLYTATFILAMNRARYDGLPQEARKAIDDNSGMAAAAMAGQAWDEASAAVRDMVEKRGNTITVLAEDEVARWKKATEPVIEAWIKAAREKGIDGGRLLDTARAALQKHRA